METFEWYPKWTVSQKWTVRPKADGLWRNWTVIYIKMNGFDSKWCHNWCVKVMCQSGLMCQSGRSKCSKVNHQESLTGSPHFWKIKKKSNQLKHCLYLITYIFVWTSNFLIHRKIVSIIIAPFPTCIATGSVVIAMIIFVNDSNCCTSAHFIRKYLIWN